MLSLCDGINHQYYNVGTMSRQVTYQHFMADDITVPMSWHPLTTRAWYIDSQTTRGAPLPRLHCEVMEFKP